MCVPTIVSPPPCWNSVAVICFFSPNKSVKQFHFNSPCRLMWWEEWWWRRLGLGRIVPFLLHVWIESMPIIHILQEINNHSPAREENFDTSTTTIGPRTLQLLYLVTSLCLRQMADETRNTSYLRNKTDNAPVRLLTNDPLSSRGDQELLEGQKIHRNTCGKQQ